MGSGPRLWAAEGKLFPLFLAGRFTQFLHAVGDQSDPEDCTVFIKPDFVVDSSDADDALPTGQFDAIVGTPRAVYLVFARTQSRTRLDCGEIPVPRKVIRRHKAFRFIRSLWVKMIEKDYAEFFDEYADRYRTLFSLELPDPEYDGQAKLYWMLEQLDPFPDEMRDVLIFVGLEGDVVGEVAVPEFTPVTVEFAEAADDTVQIVQLPDC